MHDKGAENLSVGIITQAVKDYKALLKGTVKENTNCNIIEVENFFRSEWFEFLTDYQIQGDYIIKEIRKQV